MSSNPALAPLAGVIQKVAGEFQEIAGVATKLETGSNRRIELLGQRDALASSISSISVSICRITRAIFASQHVTEGEGSPLCSLAAGGEIGTIDRELNPSSFDN